MALARRLLLFVAVVAASVLSASAKMHCEELSVDQCAFAVSSSGHRCVLEKSVLKNGEVEYECQTSVVTADHFSNWIESEACVKSCGVERLSVGMSSEALVEKEFTKTLCSAGCQSSCPNVFNLFTKLAAGEGVSLAKVCEAQQSQSRRMMADISILASQSRDNYQNAATPAPAPWQARNY